MPKRTQSESFADAIASTRRGGAREKILAEVKSLTEKIAGLRPEAHFDVLLEFLSGYEEACSNLEPSPDSYKIICTLAEALEKRIAGNGYDAIK